METKKCPYCAEDIAIEALKCKHCGEFLDGRKRSNFTPEPVVIEKKNSGCMNVLIGLAIIALLLFILGSC